MIPLLLLIVLFSTWRSAHGQDPASQLFQAAVYEEDVTGDLENAILIYATILEEHPDSRAVGARALLRTGLCYEKLGRNEARAAYERVLREFGDQIDVVALVRARLTALDRQPGTAVRQVWVPADDVTGRPSPDGHYLSFVNWPTANLAVRDLSTGVARDVTSEGTWMEPDRYAFYSIWSPEGSRLAYAWYDGDRFELRIVGLEPSMPRVLHRGDAAGYIQPFDWSHDGGSILCWMRSFEGPGRIGLISVEDGSLRILKSGVPYPVNMSLSPDGRFVVYDMVSDGEAPQDDIFLLAIAGDREAALVVHPANDYGPSWTPTGDQVLFFSDRSGASATWLQDVVDGQAQGKPALVQQNMERIGPMGFTQDGSFFHAFGLSTSPDLGDVYVAELDDATGNVLEPTALPQSFEGSNACPVWSPSGEYLAYVSVRGRWRREGFCVLVIRHMETGQERELPLKHRVRIRWSPDEKSLLAVSTAMWDRGIFVVDTRTGEQKRVKAGGPDAEITHAEFDAGGGSILYLRQQRATTEYVWSIVERDLATGSESELRRGEDVGFALSPDGQQLAFHDRQALKVMPREGGEPRELLRLPESEVFSFGVGPTWTADAGHILLGRSRAPSAGDDGLRPYDVWRIPVAGGEARKLSLRMEQPHVLGAHPDGRRIVLTQPGARRHLEVWALEDFLPDRSGSASVPR